METGLFKKRISNFSSSWYYSVNSFLFGRSISESKGLALYNGNRTLTDVVSVTSYASVYCLHFLVYYLELC